MTNKAAFLPGHHLILDMHGARDLKDVAVLEATLKAAAIAAGARVLSAEFHKFGEDGGVTGVVLLAESHITIHTWPELNLAALDIFMCGQADVEKAFAVLEERLRPHNIVRTIVKRGTR